MTIQGCVYLSFLVNFEYRVLFWFLLQLYWKGNQKCIWRFWFTLPLYPHRHPTFVNFCLIVNTLSSFGISDRLIINNFHFFVFLFSAGAMQAMVSKGIVHRDLKPQNILLSHDGRTKNPQPQDITLKIGEIIQITWRHWYNSS